MEQNKKFNLDEFLEKISTCKTEEVKVQIRPIDSLDIDQVLNDYSETEALRVKTQK